MAKNERDQGGANDRLHGPGAKGYSQDEDKRAYATRRDDDRESDQSGTGNRGSGGVGGGGPQGRSSGGSKKGS